MRRSKANRAKETLALLCRKFGISLVYLFGSQKDLGNDHLEGRPIRPLQGTDLDIGLVFRTMPEARMKAYGDIYAGLAEIFEPFSIDPVFLQETSHLFQFEAIRGHLVYAESDEAVDPYEDGVLRLASDCAFYAESFDREVMEALRDGYFQVE